MPSEVVSIIAYWQLALTILLISRWRANRPSIVIFLSLSHSLVSILKSSVEATPTRKPAAAKICAMIKATVDLPEVPVMPITTKWRDGVRYQLYAKTEKP